MIFNSIEFLIFFPVVVALYFVTPHRLRWMPLLTASYYFYMSWEPLYGLLLAGSTIITFLSSILMARAKSLKSKRAFLAAGLILNLGLLAFFKYFNFFNDALRAVLEAAGFSYGAGPLKILLPVGISFYIFKTASYVIDVYKGRMEPERHLGIYAVYVSFFPALLAGPIDRASHLIPAIREKHPLDYDRIMDGLKLMLWGFFKKLVIADRLAVYVNSAYNFPADAEGLTLLIASYFYAFEIYCDFSGYSDIAIGAAKVMGFRLTENFRRPYYARSVLDFWSRWHMSLSGWFRDYIYIPLGGNRVAKGRLYANFMIVFLLSGLWHGAAWTFVFWGGIHGAYLVIGDITSGIRTRAWQGLGFHKHSRFERLWKAFITFNLVTFAWIFFRASSFNDAFAVIGKIFSGFSISKKALLGPWSGPEFIFALCAIALLELVHILERHGKMGHLLSDKPLWIRWPLYYAILFGTLIFGVFGESEFIYFQF